MFHAPRLTCEVVQEPSRIEFEPGIASQVPPYPDRRTPPFRTRALVLSS